MHGHGTPKGTPQVLKITLDMCVLHACQRTCLMQVIQLNFMMEASMLLPCLVLPEQPKRAYYLKPGISWSNGFTQKIQIELYVNWYLYSIQAMGTGIN